MSDRSVLHETFVVERAYEAPPARVFAAWADPEAKAAWFASGADRFELDFRVGGRELNRGSMEGTVYLYDARYHEIVQDERIVYAYDMYSGDTRISVSLATVELRPEDGGTRLVFTEQGAFLDGLDTPEQRAGGTGSLLDALGDELG